ncbi:zinc finger CCCH domain-containing protein 58 isoform X1 [Syzygium oleosum]|uniref:zinc finger CCCH domain-containing protein 58 isoform X1 n=1 Tax=Syzygium oleosum TaxID=219896 RepID=UPI0024BB0A85|nr:zinc finger CCCH domain-containing protein 58 isoform X1 [Syzygium oleosum]
MDGYGGAHEGSRSDPSPEWPDDSGADTGLEEPMWQLGLGSGGGGGGEPDPAYPERPDEADCIYYLRTGYCGYGARCRFNHPRDRSAVVGATRAGGAEYPERAGQPICQFYVRTGTCKFGASCKFHHPRHGAGSSSPARLNYYGYPFRPGEKECTYYVKTGQCKFGATCKFHHPQPAGVHVHAPSPPLPVAPAPIPVAAPSSYPAVQSPSVPSSQQYGVVMARPPLVPSYVQGPYGPLLVSPSMVPFSSWSPYQAPVSPLASSGPQAGPGSSSVYGVTQLSPSAQAFSWPYQPSPSSLGPSVNGRREPSFPERPGQPECQHYMKTGDCKYGSSCKYHHPPDLNALNVNFVLSPTGLPFRPGAPPCMHFARGDCKFGPACKFDHSFGSLSYNPSVSSLGDIPIAPFPAGFSFGMLYPSYSSPELRAEIISGPTEDSLPTRSSSTTSMSVTSVGSARPSSGPAPAQMPDLSSANPASCNTKDGHSTG